MVPEVFRAGSEHTIFHSALGLGHSCVVYKAKSEGSEQRGGQIHCWGDPKMGITAVPEAVSNGVVSSAAGVEHTCAVSLVNTNKNLFMDNNNITLKASQYGR